MGLSHKYACKYHYFLIFPGSFNCLYLLSNGQLGCFHFFSFKQWYGECLLTYFTSVRFNYERSWVEMESLREYIYPILWNISWLVSGICCSVPQTCPTLCNPMDCSMPGFPVLHHLLELLKLMSIEPMMPSNHLVLSCPLLLLPSIFPSIRVFSSESVLCIRWPKYWSFSFSISPSSESVLLIRWPNYWSFSFSIILPMNIQCWFPLGLTSLISLLSKGISRVFSNTTVRKH